MYKILLFIRNFVICLQKNFPSSHFPNIRRIRDNLIMICIPRLSETLMSLKYRAFLKEEIYARKGRCKETSLEASQIHLFLLIRSRGVASPHSLHTNTLCIGLHAC